MTSLRPATTAFVCLTMLAAALAFTPTMQATAAVTVPTGRVFYVDSTVGSDSNSGLNAGTATAGQGPWRTLAKLAAVTLQPGDTIRLACGSTWNETLRVSASGSASARIIVAAYPAGCINPPVIDGGSTLPASAWTIYKGNIYKAVLATAPLDVTSATGYMTAAHHPNRGFDSTRPESLYAKVAVDSDKTSVGTRIASTYITTGSDLVLPAGASITAGLKVRIRSTAWVIDESTVSAVVGNKLTLTTPTSYPVIAGWGYYLLGRLWMLDSPGEWFYDAASGTVYAWMPDSRTPGTAFVGTTLAIGIDLNTRQYITVDGLVVRRVGTGIRVRQSKGVTLANNRIENTAAVGIDAAGCTYGNVLFNTLVRTGADAIVATDAVIASAMGLQVVGNTVTESGVALSGDTPVSLPVSNYGAIRAGRTALVNANRITNTGYNGILSGPNSTISDNVVTGVCTVLDDGGGIYANGVNNNSMISSNIVQRSRGAVAGKPITLASTQAQGIYLDEHASGVTIKNNTVTDADHGIQIHLSSNNIIQGNKLYGNRKSQLWLQEINKDVQPDGSVLPNTVIDNQIAPTAATSLGLFLSSQTTDAYGFGKFDRNVYLDRIFSRIGTEDIPKGIVDYTFSTWTTAMLPTGMPRLLDVNGKATSAVRYAPALIAGANLIRNGNLATNAYGWGSWNETTPKGVLSRQACTWGYCANYVAGSSAGLISMPNFSVVKGQWYRVSVDVLAGANGQQINLLVRRGGGGTNGYEPLSNVYFSAPAPRSWKRFTFTLQAKATVTAADPLTGDNGARLDMERIQPGQTVTLTNLEIVPITAADTATRTALLLNTGKTTTLTACPTVDSAPDSCGQFVRLTDSTPVVWPYALASRASEIVYTLDPMLVDSDGDGIADSQDRCAGTAAGSAVNSAGCGMGQ